MKAKNSVESVFRSIRAQLEKHKPVREAEQLTAILFEDLLGLDRKALILNNLRVLSDAELRIIHEAVDRLIKGEPIQYITGFTFFRGLKIKLNPNVLIPRPETEELVDLALKSIQKNSKVLDWCTGSGCIALAVKNECPYSKVFARDASGSALAVARNNANQLNLKIEFEEEDLLQPGEWDHSHFFDTIIANPPYVRKIELQGMEKNVSHFEPHEALFVDDNESLIFYAALADYSFQFLKPKGCIFFEINENLGNEVVSLLQQKGMVNVALHKDQFNKNRFVTAEKPVKNGITE